MEEVSLSNKRLQICEACPLLKKQNTKLYCNPNLYLNPKTNEISNKPKTGFKHGCGCSVLQKIKMVNGKCPLEKW